MNATIRIDTTGKALDGTYLLTWNGPRQWREEISLPGYNEVNVGKDLLVYTRRSLSYMPVSVFELQSTLGFRWRAHPGLMEGEIIKKVHAEKIAGRGSTCVEIAHGKSKREVCVDDETGTFNRTKGGYRDSDFLPIGAKLFPRSMSWLLNRVPRLEVRVTSIDTSAVLEPGLFEPPAGAIERRGCFLPTPDYKLTGTAPKFPLSESSVHHRGGVNFYASVDENGVPQNLKVFSSTDPSLVKPFLEAEMNSRFKPATCDGNPVSQDVFLQLEVE